MPVRKSLLSLTLVAGLGFLAGCDSAEERAEKHFQSGLALLQAGDVDRALVEFRNVFKLDSRHAEARLAYARVEQERGNLKQAYGQYLRLVEQYPENLEGRRALAEMAAEDLNWVEVERHVTAALELAPDDVDLQALALGLDYSKAVEARDSERRRQIGATARQRLEAQPGSVVLHRVSIDAFLLDQKLQEALEQADAALVHAPQDRNLLGTRLAILNQLGDMDGVEEQLRAMVAASPDDPAMRATLIRWFISRGQTEKAETYLRSGIDRDSDDPSPVLELVNFLVQLRGPEAALAELDAVIADGKAPIVFGAVRAGLIFDLGRRDEAIAEMQSLIDTADDSADLGNTRVTLARMLVTTGNSVGARALVEQVLATDPSEVEALKLKAGWQIDDDNTADAIATLRNALESSPRDPQLMTLMARAHERDGNRELVGEMLALATEASNRAPAESLQYANFLISTDKLRVAEEVLVDALRLSPDNPAILIRLGDLYVEMEDWGRAEQVAASLEASGTPETQARATALRASVLRTQQKTSETIGYLEQLIASGEAGLGAKIEILRTHLANGNTEAARNYAAELLAEKPADPSLRFVEASVRGLTDDPEGAARIYRELVTEDPKRLPVWLALYRHELTSDNLEEAADVLSEARAALPDQAELKWAEAGLREKRGDIDGAIAIYEELYSLNTGNALVANNLASLISTYRNDPESVERAYVYARRLRGTEFAPYQDTYGWIMHQRGDSDEALRYLEPAAAALKTDPMVQYHLAEVLAALGRDADALAQFRKVLELAPAEDPRAFVATTREQIARIEALPEGE